MKYLPLILGLVILAVAASLVPWDSVWPYLLKLPPLTILLLVICSGFYYLGRILRYWLLMRMLGHPVAFYKVALACLVAQPVSILPGGELYRGAMLKRYGNVELSHGIPGAFAQSIAESVGLLLIALAGISVLHRYVGILFILVLIFGGLMLFFGRRRHSHSHRLVNMVPGVNIHHSRWRSFLDKNRTLLTGSNFVVLLLASLVSTFAGVAIVYLASHALGAHLTLFKAAIAYALPVVIEAVSFLPGGLGVNETGSIGVLTLFDINLPLAVAITLIMRLFTLGLGFVYGFAAMGWDRLGRYRHYD